MEPETQTYTDMFSNEINAQVTDEQESGDNKIEDEEYAFTYPTYNCEKPWTHVCGSIKEFETVKTQGFLKGCKWSPDGTCLLTCADDNVMRLYDLPASFYQYRDKAFDGIDLPELTPSLRIKEGELVYDFCWHPHMSSWKPETLASTSKNGPIHFWDAYKGNLAATYRAYNNVDEVEAAYSLCISPDGEKLLTGFNKCVRIFHINRPGRECSTISTKSSDILTASQSGIISCLAVNPGLPSVYAAGSYMKSIGLYSEQDGTSLCVLEGHKGGVTHITFSPDGLMLYSGGRKDPEIICWDLRNPGCVLFIMKRTVDTNQRIYFDLDPSGRYLISGETSGLAQIWDTQIGLEMKASEDPLTTILPAFAQTRAHSDCTNGISCHPWLPLIATSSGQRHVTPLFDRASFDSDDEGNETDETFIPKTRENSVKLWWVGKSADDLVIRNASPVAHSVD
nr:EOG090X06W9 [Sida crystallina]